MLSSGYKSNCTHSTDCISCLEDLPLISVHLIVIFFRYAAAASSWFLILVLVPSCSTVRICNGYLSFWTCFIKVTTTLNMEREKISSAFQWSCSDMAGSYKQALSPQLNVKHNINLDILHFYKKTPYNQFATDSPGPCSVPPVCFLFVGKLNC